MGRKSVSSSKTVSDIAANCPEIDLNDTYNSSHESIDFTMAFYFYNFPSEADATRMAQFERFSTEEAREACRACFSPKNYKGHKSFPS